MMDDKEMLEILIPREVVLNLVRLAKALKIDLKQPFGSYSS